MHFSHIFIERPVMTTLLTFAILLFGIVGFRALPIAALPAVDYPTIQVTAFQPGANPETMASSIATPLEREFSTIAGVRSISSSNTQGGSTITIQFALNRDIDAAAQDVQSAIAQAVLPPMPRPPSYAKQNPSEQPILYFSLGSTTLPLYTVNEYAETMLAQRMSSVSGVSRVQVFGAQKYAVRIQADPDRLAAHQVGVDEVQRAVQQSNVNLPTGRLRGPKQSFTVQSTGQLMEAAAYRPLIVEWRNGVPLRLEELASVVDSVEDNKTIAWNNGTRSIILAVSRQPGTNTVDIVDKIRKILPELRKALPPAVEFDLLYDGSETVRGSIHDVEFTLILTIALVVLVIFLFLRNLSATLIPGSAVVLSIIGTFAAIYLLGYSLNTLSLMALTLCVGFVVDDAIVMLENIVRYMEMGHGRYQAAALASKEIGFTIISMTLSLIAVFIPVLFLGGMVGRLLHEFSVTIIVAILISGFVSLTFTPMLGSRFLPPHNRKHGALYRALERGFNSIATAYDYTLRSVLRHKFATMAVALAMLAGTIYIFMTMPTGFIPSQDSGYIFAVSMAGQDISYRAMAERQKMVADVMKADPNVSGAFAFSQESNVGYAFSLMKPRNQRKLTVDQTIEQLRPKLAAVRGMMTFLQNPPPITINGQFTTSVYQMTLQSVSLNDIYEWTPKLTQKIQTLPGFVDVSSDLLIASPQLKVDIDRDRALSLGVTPEQVQNALYSSFGDRQVSNIYAPANQYSVILEVQPEYQGSPDALQKLYVRSARGQLVPLDEVARVVRTVGPLSVNHFGQIPASTISFNLKPGFSLGEAADRVNEAVRELRMPASLIWSFQGTVKEFQESFQGLTILLIVAILVIYIVLGVLYESFIHPITILSGLPSAVFGALLTLVLFHKELDLYAFVGLIMLFGVVKKNAIMMIDFAIEAQREGRSPREAIYRGCTLRFRPIMMTTMAALFGTLPIAIGYGEGGDARQALGLAVVGGLVVSQLLTLYITPVLYLYLDQFQVWLRRAKPVPEPSVSFGD
ncbi:MAG: acriflavine resistance protein B [Acidobacteria bacterium]|nr:MAG: acriflavine resistance protein B [Acidobacteriota bacterium]